MFTKEKADFTGPGMGAFQITPNDSTDLTTIVRAIYVGTEGVINCQFVDGSECPIPVAANVPHFLRVTRVLATGTTADGIVGIV